MSKFFANLSELESYLQNNLPKLIIEDKGIENILKRTMQEAVKDVVYEHYYPTQYKRRGDNGGLSDVRLMQFTDAFLNGTTFTMIFENLAKGRDSLNGEYISETIENGIEDNWYNPNGAWSDSRPFVKETAKNITIEPKYLIEAVKKAFVRAGFEVR